jgi:glucose-1-phosphate cytidylyltransferase
MKAVILAGGLGTRLSEETVVRPKPMVEIGGKPILWHIMKVYSSHGIDEFVVCLGYKGYMIKEYFANYYLHTCDVTFDITGNSMEVHQSTAEPWRVTLVDTGLETMTGGRLKRALAYVGDENFCFTYGDGLSDVDLSALVAYHGEQGTVATVTAVQPPGRTRCLRRAHPRLPREARGRRRMGQRRLLRRVAFDRGVHRGRSHDLGARADGAPRRRGRALGLQALRLLEGDGHAPR